MSVGQRRVKGVTFCFGIKVNRQLLSTAEVGFPGIITLCCECKARERVLGRAG